jgi:hypothetical protein
VDGPDKPGHDGVDESKPASFGIRRALFEKSAAKTFVIREPGFTNFHASEEMALEVTLGNFNVMPA